MISEETTSETGFGVGRRRRVLDKCEGPAPRSEGPATTAPEPAGRWEGEDLIVDLRGRCAGTSPRTGEADRDLRRDDPDPSFREGCTASGISGTGGDEETGTDGVLTP